MATIPYDNLNKEISVHTSLMRTNSCGALTSASRADGFSCLRLFTYSTLERRGELIQKSPWYQNSSCANAPYTMAALSKRFLVIYITHNLDANRFPFTNSFLVRRLSFTNRMTFLFPFFFLLSVSRREISEIWPIMPSVITRN